MEDFHPDIFPKQSLVILVISTHYEGDPCDNTKKFYKWFREQIKNKNSSLFNSTKFSVFGLGDTSYEQFNAMGRYFDKGLEELGGKRIHQYGEGNAEKNKTEDDFLDWKMDVWKNFAKHYAESEDITGPLIPRKQSTKVDLDQLNQLPL